MAHILLLTHDAEFIDRSDALRGGCCQDHVHHDEGCYVRHDEVHHVHVFPRFLLEHFSDHVIPRRRHPEIDRNFSQSRSLPPGVACLPSGYR